MENSYQETGIISHTIWASGPWAKGRNILDYDGWAGSIIIPNGDGWAHVGNGWAEVVGYYVDGCTKVDVYQIAGRLCKGVKWKLVFQALFIKALRWKMKVLQYGTELCKVVKWKLKQSGPSSETRVSTNKYVISSTLPIIWYFIEQWMIIDL
ncbi:hypothetical protein DEU56DRAFT_753526 [Suillus clintonianus]|uniref:uncharacterized protein n=1 Tax=Suillus clintonianus TaxID=1904413 RepID=UPI001B8791B8|nr:uncharacterized protein DEU56DRAFT_753526 [Suillus clintonianus]KAG2147705.1 hypothetical protein DEU56DRAFT_753526 [Suillus clintonianus]